MLVVSSGSFVWFFQKYDVLILIYIQVRRLSLRVFVVSHVSGDIIILPDSIYVLGLICYLNM
jgi:hypothetical protein